MAEAPKHKRIWAKMGCARQASRGGTTVMNRWWATVNNGGTQFVRADLADGYREALVKWGGYFEMKDLMVECTPDELELLNLAREALAKGDEDNG